MTGPGRPQTCSHPINAQTLTGVCQAVGMFSPCQCHVLSSMCVCVLSQTVEISLKWCIFSTYINEICIALNQVIWFCSITLLTICV